MPISLDYQPAKVYFSGEQRGRSIVVVVVFVFGLAFAGVGLGIRLSQPPSLPLPPRAMLGAFVVVGALLAGYAVIAFVADLRWPVAVRSDGILMQGRLHAWQSIRRVAAVARPQDAQVILFFVGRFGMVHTNTISMRMERAAYEALMERLRQEVGVNHPDVDLKGGYELPSD